MSAANATIADMRVKLSILWVFAVLNYIYADVFTALDSSSNNGSVTLSHAQSRDDVGYRGIHGDCDGDGSFSSPLEVSGKSVG